MRSALIFKHSIKDSKGHILAFYNLPKPASFDILKWANDIRIRMGER